MLNPEKFNEKISKFEKGLDTQAKKKDELISEIKKARKSNRKCLLGLLLVAAMIAFVVLAFCYAPLREYCCALLKFDVNNPTTSDIYKGIAIVLGLKFIEVIIVTYAEDWNFSMLGFNVLFGFTVLFTYIGDNNSTIRWRKKDLKANKKDTKKIQEKLTLALKEKEAETEKLLETKEMFERGVAENDLKLIQQAAALGNPDAMMAEGKRLYEQAKESENMDIAVLEDAAKYGYPNAIFELAEFWLDEATAELLTSAEKSELLKKVDSYVKGADFSNHPDGRIFQISRQVFSTEKKDLHKLLEEVRSIRKEEQLSDKYTELADIIIKELIRQIDRL